jgi:subtilisin-like proprotein convertase family protein
MKNGTRVVAVFLLALATSARADFTFNSSSPGWQNGGVIPDGPLTGWSDTRTISMPGMTSIQDVNVTLNLSGGWNGDLYAYLTHGDGFAVLLNRVGRGESGVGAAGFQGGGTLNVRLDDSALLNIHAVGSPGTPPTYAYQPDGRNISPLETVGNFTLATATAQLGRFSGINPNGSWTLFIADVSGGDVNTLNSWSLEIAAVPEPASLIEGSVAVLFLGGVVWLYRRKQAKTNLQPF